MDAEDMAVPPATDWPFVGLRILGFLNGALYAALVAPVILVGIPAAGDAFGFRVGMESIVFVLIGAAVAAVAGTVGGVAVALSRRDREALRSGLRRLWKIQLVLLPILVGLAALADFACGPVVC